MGQGGAPVHGEVGQDDYKSISHVSDIAISLHNSYI